MDSNASSDDIAAAAVEVAPKLRALLEKYIEHWARQASDTEAFAACAHSLRTASELNLTAMAQQVAACLLLGEVASRWMRVPHDYDIVAFSTLPCTRADAPAVIRGLNKDPYPYTEWVLQLIQKSVERYSHYHIRHFIHLVACCEDDHIWLHLGVHPGSILKEPAAQGYTMYPGDLLTSAERDRVSRMLGGRSA